MKTVFLYFFISRRYILVQISSPLCVLGGISWPVRAWVKGVRWYNQGLPSRVFSPLWRCPRWNTSQRKGEREEERGKEWEWEGGNGLFLSLATASSSHSPPYPPSSAVASPLSVAALPPAPSSPTTVGQQGVRRRQWQRRWRGRAES